MAGCPGEGKRRRSIAPPPWKIPPNFCYMGGIFATYLLLGAIFLQVGGFFVPRRVVCGFASPLYKNFCGAHAYRLVLSVIFVNEVVVFKYFTKILAVTPGTLNSAELRGGGLQRAIKDSTKGGCNNFLLFTR